jgi:hypothetical protein
MIFVEEIRYVRAEPPRDAPVGLALRCIANDPWLIDGQ